MPTKIIIDTNFLLIPAQFNVDIFSELKRICDFRYEMCIMEGTIAELEKIQKDESQKGSDKRAAKMALSLLKKQEYKIIKSGIEHVDDAILDYCEKHECAVATQDALLKKRLKEQGSKIIILRSRKFLKVE